MKEKNLHHASELSYLDFLRDILDFELFRLGDTLFEVGLLKALLVCKLVSKIIDSLISLEL